MTKRENKRKRRAARAKDAGLPTESKASEAVTVAWTVSVTSLVFCDLAILAIHYLAGQESDSSGLHVLRELLLLAGALAGAISLVLLAVVYRVRQVPPPPGLTVFGALVAIGPLLTLLLQQFR